MANQTTLIFYLVLILAFPFSLFGQDKQVVINLKNPSFEDIPSSSQGVRGWFDCGQINHPAESPPDVQPRSLGLATSMGQSSSFFGVRQIAAEGNTYLGMVVRDNDTWESVAQRLTRPMESGQCYSFSLSLCRSESYMSASRITGKSANYTKPAVVRIWGGHGFCDAKELLNADESGNVPIIENHEWKRYNFKLKPTSNITHIIIEVFYKTPILFSYNGNVLLDDVSPIKSIPCDVDDLKEPVAEITSPVHVDLEVSKRKFAFSADVKNVDKKEDITLDLNGEAVKNYSFDPITGEVTAALVLRQGKNKVTIRAENLIDTAEAFSTIIYKKPIIIAENEPIPQSYEVITPKSPEKPKETKLLDIDRKDFVKGQTIAIKKLLFEADITAITMNSYTVLDRVYSFLRDNPDVKIEIGGHTNNTPSHAYCDTLSTNRAKSVAKYLVKKGISEERLAYKGYGKREPIASNKSKAGRQKNQRVEIKILSFKKK